MKVLESSQGMNTSVFSNKNILIPFSMIFSTELSTLRFMQNKYKNSSYFDMSLLDNNEDKRIILYLLSRDSEDPLSIIKTSDMNTKSLFKQIYEANIEQILEHEYITNIFNFINSALTMKNVNIFIWCEHEYEAAYSKKILPDCFTTVSAICDLDIEKKEIILLDKLSSLNYLKPFLSGKSVYLGKTAYNMSVDAKTDEFYIPQEYLKELQYAYMISIFLIDMYILDENYFIGG